MYKKMAQQLKQQVEAGKVPDGAKEGVLQSIEVYKFLGEAEDRGLLQDLEETLLDEGRFNEAIKGYLAMALNDVDLAQTEKDAIESNLRYYLDTKTAAEAAQYYREH